MSEEWRDVVGYEGIYQVSNLGRVKSLKRVIQRSNGRSHETKERVMKPKADDCGYLRTALSGKGKLRAIRIHREVAKAFLANPFNKETVNHINGKKEDNRPVNLEWATRKENLDHSFRTGLQDNFLRASKERGIKSRKLSDNDVRDVFLWSGMGYGCHRLASAYNINKKTVMSVLKRETYKDVRI